MTKVLKADASLADAYVVKAVALTAPWYIQADLAVPADTLAALQGASDFASANLISLDVTPTDEGFFLGDGSTSESLDSPASAQMELNGGSAAALAFVANALRTVVLHYDGTDMHVLIGGAEVLSYAVAITNGSHDLRLGAWAGNGVANEIYYATNVLVGTTLGGQETFADDFASGDLAAWDSHSGSVYVIDNPFPSFSPYATTTELFRILSKNNPSGPQITAAQGDLDTATIEINTEIDWADDHAAATPEQLELMKGVCLDRAADLWRHRESAPGILGMADEGLQPAGTGRYSWARYSARLSVIKDQWAIA